MQNKKVFLSVIIPVYNVEKYLAECLDSFLRQDYEACEAIVIDDGSQDQTLEIAEKYEKIHENIIVLKTDHGGQAKARNMGICRASGEYITFLDGDDYWEEGHLNKLAAMLESSLCDICVGNRHYVVQDGIRSINKLFDTPEAGTVGGTALLFTNSNIPASMCLVTYKKAFLAKNAIHFQEEYLCGEDFDFFMHAIINTEHIATVGHLYYNYRKDNTTSTYSVLTGTKVLVLMQVLKKWYDFFLAQEEHTIQRENILNGIRSIYQGALTMEKKLKKRDDRRGEIFNYLSQTQYILWPEQKPRRFLRFYLCRTRMMKKGREIFFCMAGRIKRLIRRQ